ncbi:hypothetical protein [Actinoplanes subglobosus]|uniref:Uncharacterized protein n=1 Tax=Actinoplanes subglobosus TaxID=1547892 RepID=A0ABV8J1B6_9ACTN
MRAWFADCRGRLRWPGSAVVSRLVVAGGIVAGMTGPLLDGGLDRARRWAETLASATGP